MNNVAGKVSWAEPTECNDVRFIIKVIDKDTEQEHTLSNIVVNSEDGWVDLEYDVSRYAGKTVTMKAESHAGGPCGNWKAEWAAMDYFMIYEKQ